MIEAHLPRSYEHNNIHYRICIKYHIVYTAQISLILLVKYFSKDETKQFNLNNFCSKSHDDRVLFEPTSAIWAHIARGKAECYMSPNSTSILK